MKKTRWRYCVTTMRLTALVFFILCGAAIAESTGTIWLVKPSKPTGWVNLRTEPSMESEGLARATLNQEVTVLDEDGEWAHVIFDGKEGFMKTEFLEKTTGGLASSKTTGISSPSGNGYEMKLYMETPNPGGSITIQYSYFSGTKANELNALVEKAVQETIKKHTDSMIYEYPMTLNYQAAVTLNNDNMVSIVFWGWCNWGSSDGIGKDFSDLVTLNIDLSTMKAVTFADLYRVDSAFVDIFFSKSYFPSDPVTSYSKVLFPEMLAMQKNVQPFSISNNVQCLEEENIFRKLAHVIRTSSGERKIPVVASKGEASWVDEEGLIPESDDKFGQVTIGSYKLGTMIKISDELLADSVFNMPAYIAKEFARRIGNKEEDSFFNGNGTGKPLGILSDTGGGEVGVTATAAAAITFDDVMDLYYSLKSPYRRKASFLLNDQTVKAIRKLKDNNGQYLWNPSVKDGVPDKILNRPYHTSDFMPTLKASAKALVFGDYSYYWVADRQGRVFKRLNELYAPTGQVGFLATQRVDGRLILPEAIKIMKMKAS